MSEYDNLLTDDQDWLRSFSASLKILEDWTTGQQALWPIDDLLGTKGYVPCPRRGLHARLVDCWMCWCDVMRGAAIEPEVLAPDAWAGN